MSSFEFKYFSVEQSGSAMKVGTDGVLLGAWATVDASAGRILDLGTGSGVIALMAAQRSVAWSAEIVAIDIESRSCGQAKANFEASPWRERLSAMCVDFTQYSSKQPATKFDSIISNPPFFNDSLLPPDPRRSVARHTASLSYDALVEGSGRLLVEGGRLAVVIPAEVADKFVRLAGGEGFALLRKTWVFTKPAAQPKRVLLEFALTDNQPTAVVNDLYITAHGAFTEEYMALTHDFYLKF